MLNDARWITRQPRPYSLTAPAPYLRKRFTLDKEIASASLTMCAVGLGICEINGKRVTNDLLTTPVSNYDKSVYYNVYDVTDKLSVGKNAIGFILGNGAYNDNNDHWGMSAATWRDLPKVIAKLSIGFTDGSTKDIVTDASFVTHDSPTTYNNIRCGEDYDARECIEGWSSPELDETGWDKAVIKPGPGGELKPNIMPPIRRIEEITPVRLKNGVFDLGKNISGHVKFVVKGSSGDTLRVVYAERLNEDGSINNDNENMLTLELGRVHSDNYILRGDDTEEWEPSFTYHGFRYFAVETNATFISVKGVLHYTDLEKIGDFECSDEMLNKIHSASVMSTLTCFHSIPEDCPQREQQGWTGDAVLSAEQAIFNFDMTDAYSQWLDDFADEQRPNGAVPCINPCPGRGWTGTWDGGPAWDGALILIPYYLYRYTGNIKLIEKHFDIFVKYLGYLDTIRDGYIVNSGLGDWNPPSRKRISHSITNTCYYHTITITVAECAKLLGHDPTPYLQLAANIRKDYREKFINSTIPDMNTQTALACGIYHGMYEADEIPEVIERLVKLIEDNDFHIDCGCLGTKAMFTVLCEWGHADLMLKMVKNPTPPSYAYWITNGMNTLCERWYMDASRNHHYFSEVDHWFYKYIAGIRLSPDGIEIQPCFVDGITWVRARHCDISVYYDEEKLVIEVPKPATLTLCGEKIPLLPGKNEIGRK